MKGKEFRYLIERAKCDIILFLCTSSVPSKFHSTDAVKQMISAHWPNQPDQPQVHLPTIGYTFTRCLVDTLDKMYDSTPFPTQRLLNEFIAALSRSKYGNSAVHPAYPWCYPELTTSGDPGNITIASQRPHCLLRTRTIFLEFCKAHTAYQASKSTQPKRS